MAAKLTNIWKSSFNGPRPIGLQALQQWTMLAGGAANATPLSSSLRTFHLLQWLLLATCTHLYVSSPLDFFLFLILSLYIHLPCSLSSSCWCWCRLSVFLFNVILLTPTKAAWFWSVVKVSNGALRASFRLRDRGFSNFVSSKSVIFYFRVCDSVIDSMIFESNYYVHCFDILPSFQTFCLHYVLWSTIK